MIDSQMINSVKQYMTNLQHHVVLRLQKGEHSKKAELRAFLQQIVETSSFLSLEEGEFAHLVSPLSFELWTKEATGIVFSGIPGGHEFSSLILAILQAGGASGLKLDQSLQQLIAGISMPLTFQTYVSLSCHNCPDVVQALNQFALLNKEISHEMIDGGLFTEQVEALGLQGVPSVYLNGKPFANGKIDTARLVEKLLSLYPELGASKPAEQLPLQDVLVLGGGPAGVAAAIYAARKGLAVSLIAERIGGQVKDTVDIENFISVAHTTGAELAGNMQQHLRKYAVNVREGLRVKTLEKQGDEFLAVLNTGEEIRSKTAIVATGAKWRELGVAGEKENIGQGVAYCPHCDGPFFKSKNVAVVGGGNSGIEAAIDLAGIAAHVTVLEFAETLKADKVLVDVAESRENITILTGVATQSIEAENNRVCALHYVNRADNRAERLALEGVFVQIGLLPNSDFLGDWVEKTAYGEVKIDAHCRTNVAGLFACGDVSTVPYKQIVIAMGEGAKAALSAFDYLVRL